MTSSKTPLACALGLLVSTGALAQETSRAESQSVRKGSASLIMEEVQVVARKRKGAEAAQEVPLAITAYGAEQMDAMYLKDLKDLSFSMPSVQTDEVGTFPGVQNFTIRGQGINSSIPSVDPTVGVFVDGMFLGISYGVVMDVFDLEGLEVLRGPQGLLFGRNVTGGAVVMRTARPDGELGVKARVRVSTGLEKNVAISMEDGLTDNLAGKLVLYYNDDTGYWENTTETSMTDPFWAARGITAIPDGARSNRATGDEAGERTNKFARGTLVWDATEDLELTLITEKGKMDGDGAVWTTREGFNDRGLDSDETDQDENGFTDMEWEHAIIEANWNIGNGVLTNILAYRDLNSQSRADIDGLSAPLFNVPGFTNQDQISNELRYAFSSDDGTWDVTTGLYYFQQDIEYREQRWGGIGLLLGTPLPVVNTVNLGGDMDHETWGVFASADYTVTDRVTLTAGLRYTKEEKDAKIVNADPLAGGTPCVDITYASCTFDALDDSWENLTPKLGVNWQLTDEVMLYGLYTKGFRSGGVNFRNALPSVINPGPTDEEEQDAFELGFKSDLANGRLRLNGALYHVEISDMQRELNVGSGEIVDEDTGFDLVAGTGVLVWQATVNAGDVDITGAELEFVALVQDNFAINGSLGYVDSEYQDISDEIRAAEAQIGSSLIGADLPRLAPWTASIGFTYDLDLGDNGALTFRGGYSFRDEAAYNDSNTQVFESKRMANASIQWTSADAHWTASIFGKNLNDEVQWGSLNALIETSGAATKGRVYGAELTYTY